MSLRCSLVRACSVGTPCGGTSDGQLLSTGGVGPDSSARTTTSWRRPRDCWRKSCLSPFASWASASLISVRNIPPSGPYPPSSSPVAPLVPRAGLSHPCRAHLPIPRLSHHPRPGALFPSPALAEWSGHRLPRLVALLRRMRSFGRNVNGALTVEYRCHPLWIKPTKKHQQKASNLGNTGEAQRSVALHHRLPCRCGKRERVQRQTSNTAVRRDAKVRVTNDGSQPIALSASSPHSSLLIGVEA